MVFHNFCRNFLFHFWGVVKWRTSKIPLFFLGIALLLSGPVLPFLHAENSTSPDLSRSEIYFDESVDQKSYDLLSSDLEYLAALSRSARSLSTSWDKWLKERVYWIVGSNYLEASSSPIQLVSPFDAPSEILNGPLATITRCEQYPFPDLFPRMQSPPDFLLRKLATQPPGSAVLGNLTPAFYLQAKRLQKTAVVKLAERKSRDVFFQPLLTNQWGIIQIYPHFFISSKIRVHPDETHTLNRIVRLSFLIHEAGHSDGNGESMGFFHSLCPPGHQYEGMPACDANLNGPYFKQVTFLKTYIPNYSSFPQVASLIKDLESRILKNGPENFERIQEIEKQLLICDALPRSSLSDHRSLPPIFQICIEGLEKLKSELTALYHSGPQNTEWSEIPESCERK